MFEYVRGKTTWFLKRPITADNCFVQQTAIMTIKYLEIINLIIQGNDRPATEYYNKNWPSLSTSIDCIAACGLCKFQT